MLELKSDTKPEKDGVGVIVGRFQVMDLHEGHSDLIETVSELHDKVLVVIGLSPIKATGNNPMDFVTREKMIAEKYPEVTVVYIQDVQCNDIWSKRLDDIVKTHSCPGSKAIAYGSRDSFIRHYKGRMETKEFVQSSVVSGTALRKTLTNKIKSSSDFRHGVIWATGNRYPVAFPTVDVAIMNDDETKVLLGRKEHETEFRFVGGFVDPSAEFGKGALETNVRREVYEETHLEITMPEYIGSFFVDDWRYRSEIDKVMTVFFKAKKVSGREQPDDDIEELKWFPINLIGDRKQIMKEIVEEHKPLMQALLPKVDWGV